MGHLTSHELGVLRELYRGPARTDDIADAIGLQPDVTAFVVGRMVSRGFVGRDWDREGPPVWRLTAAGESAAAAGEQLHLDDTRAA